MIYVILLHFISVIRNVLREMNFESNVREKQINNREKVWLVTKK